MEHFNKVYRSADLKILIHHIYECRKGLRNIALHTMNAIEREKAEELLSKKEINYFVQEVNQKKINIFLGNPDCIEIIKSFGVNSLSEYSPEQDFMLGIMLGYDTKKQFSRYLGYKNRKQQLRVI